MRVWMPYLKAGSGVDVFTRRLAGALAEFGIEAISEVFPKHLQYCPWALKAAPAPEGISAIIANSWNAIGFAREGIPLISTQHLCVHDPLYAPYRSKPQAIFHRSLVRFAEAQGFRRADAIVSVSESTAEATRAAFPEIFCDKRIHTILNGIDTSFFEPGEEMDAIAEELDQFCAPEIGLVPPSRLVPNTSRALRTLLFVGNPTRRKGSDLLIPIMEALGPDWTLNVIQGREKAEELQGHPQINLMGRKDREGVRQAMREAGLMLFPTRLEGLPLSAIEAMACGLPVAAADTSSLPEVISDGLDGLLCRLDDPQDFARRISAAMGSPHKALAMRQAARAKAATLFSERRMARDWAGLIRTLVSDPEQIGASRDKWNHIDIETSTQPTLMSRLAGSREI